jgi:hypothetical protein
MPTPPFKNPLKINFQNPIRFISVVSTVMAAITLGLAIFALSSFNNNSGSPTALTRWALAHGMDGGFEGKWDVQVEDNINSIKDEQKRLNERIDALSKVTNQTALSAEVTDIKSSVDDLNTRFSKVEGILIQNPQEAVAIPLLRKDLDNLSSKTDLQIALLQQDADRSYNLVLVTIVALAIAVLAPALGNIFKKDEKGKDKE